LNILVGVISPAAREAAQCPSARGIGKDGETPERGEKGPMDGICEGAWVGQRGEVPCPYVMGQY